MYKYKYSMRMIKMLLFCIIMLAISTMISNQQVRDKEAEQKNIALLSEKLEEQKQLEQIEQERLEEEKAQQQQEIQEQTENIEQETPQQETYTPTPQINPVSPDITSESDENKEEAQFYITRAKLTIEVGDYTGAIDLYKKSYELIPSKDVLMAIGELSILSEETEPLKTLLDQHLSRFPKDKSYLGKYLDYIKLRERKAKKK